MKADRDHTTGALGVLPLGARVHAAHAIDGRIAVEPDSLVADVERHAVSGTG